MLAHMQCARDARRILQLVAAMGLAVAASGCARRGRDPSWVDVTPNGFVAAPIDPALDAGPDGDLPRGDSGAPPGQ